MDFARPATTLLFPENPTTPKKEKKYPSMNLDEKTGSIFNFLERRLLPRNHRYMMRRLPMWK
jgi:hypothetical protein